VLVTRGWASGSTPASVDGATSAWPVGVNEEASSRNAGEGCGAAKGAACEAPPLLLVADGALPRG